MPRLDRQAILGKLQAMKKARQPVIGGGAGTGLSAKCEEAGGIDHLQFRSLPHGGAGLTCWRARPRQRERDRAGGAALDVNPEAIILVHGGPVAEPQDTEFILRSTERCHALTVHRRWSACQSSAP
jgi:predicted TIM-barrel enzyme